MHQMTGSGTVTVETPTMGNFAQVVVVPIGSASGTLTITAQMSGGEDFQAVYDAAGEAVAGLSLASEICRVFKDCRFSAIKVVSTESGDSFRVAVST